MGVGEKVKGEREKVKGERGKGKGEREKGKGERGKGKGINLILALFPLPLTPYPVWLMPHSDFFSEEIYEFKKHWHRS